MKIINDNCAYVQKNDLGFLNQTNIPIPASIFTKVFGNEVTIINDSNRYDFIKFENEDEIEYFKSIDWMIDYNNVKDLTERQTIRLSKRIIKEHEAIASTFNNMSEEEKENNKDMITKCELLKFKFYSLRDILWLKQGHIKMNLPKEFARTYKEAKRY